MKNKIIALIIIFSIALNVISVPYYQNVSAKTNVSKDNNLIYPVILKQDTDYLVQKLKNVHMSTLNGFNDKQKAAIARLYEKIKEPMTKTIYTYSINEMLTSFEDGHTTCWSVPEKVFVNLPICWLKEGIIIKKDTALLKKGDKLISIEDKSEKEILGLAKTIISSENEYWVKYNCQKYMTYYTFYKYLGILKNEVFLKIKVERNGEIKEINLPFQNEYPGSSTDLYMKNKWIEWNTDANYSLGYFYLSACNYNDEYKKNVDEFFNEVISNKIDNIVIDLRNNTGGNSSVLNYFLSYLNVDSFYDVGIKARVSTEIIEKFPQYYNSVGIEESSIRKVINNKKEKTSNAAVYILISNKSFSSASMFAYIYQDNKIATIVGEPNGNKPTCYGDVYQFSLPNSKLQISTTYKEFYRPNKKKDSEDAVYPDVYAYTTRNDLINGRDPQMQKVYELIKEKNPQKPAITTKTSSGINFKDKNFENEIRKIINKPTGDIFAADVKDIKRISIEENRNIQSIEGIEYFENLKSLEIAYNPINNIESIKNLKNLNELYLYCDNIEDISPINALFNLKRICFTSNRISDISALKNLNHLEDLQITNNPITEQQIAELKEALPKCSIRN